MRHKETFNEFYSSIPTLIKSSPADARLAQQTATDRAQWVIGLAVMNWKRSQVSDVALSCDAIILLSRIEDIVHVQPLGPI